MRCGGLATVYIGLLVLLCHSATQIDCKQTQKFVLSPKDANIKLGETAVFNCSVTDIHGDVQWTHDGTALGYDRKVPGKPRYSVIWYENENTEYHLKIENVTMEDEGQFSCQAAPIDDWDTKLEKTAKLIVLVGPTKPPEIMFNNEIKRSGDIVNFRAVTKLPNKYSCSVDGAKPAATIKWFVNGTLVSSSVGTTKDTSKSDLNDIIIILKKVVINLCCL